VGACGLTPLNADAPAIFFLLTCVRMCFLAAFGHKPWNYYFDVFHNFHNSIGLRAIKTRTEDLNFSFVGLASYSFGYKLVLDTAVIRIRIFTILGIIALSF